MPLSPRVPKECTKGTWLDNCGFGVLADTVLINTIKVVIVLPRSSPGKARVDSKFLNDLKYRGKAQIERIPDSHAYVSSEWNVTYWDPFVL